MAGVSGWTLAEYQGDDGGAYVVRARALPPADERARYPQALWLSWPSGPIASEAEEDAILDEMIRFENAVHAACEKGGWGMLVAVVTTGAAREWLFYAANGTEFLGELNGLTAGKPWPALEVRVFDDPTWKAARELSPRGRMH